MNLIGEIFSKLKIKECDYQLVNVSGKAVYISGHKGIVVFSDKQMVFKLKNRKTLMVVGKELSIIEMDEASALIGGEIISLEVV